MSQSARPFRGDAAGLLTQIMERPLDPAYAAAARARGGGPRAGRPWFVGGVMLLAGLLFTTSATTQGRALRDEGRAGLVTRIEAQERRVDAASARIAAATGGQAAADGAVAPSPAGLSSLAGLDPVTGPGVRVRLDDAESLGEIGGGGPREAAGEDGRIQARDIQNVTNDLWAAGAEAVAIGGHRLTSTTAIRFAGRAVLVGYRPLARPYVIEAVMGPEAAAAYLDGPGGTYLADLRTAFGARAQAERVDALTLPGATPLPLRHATPAGSDRRTDAPASPTTRKDDG